MRYLFAVTNEMDFRTPLAKARGLGSAKSGFHHWWNQRISAIALIPLSLWFGFSLLLLPGANYTEVVDWIRLPWNAVLLISFIVSSFYHAFLGVQVVVEDYIHIEWLKIGSILATKLLLMFLALLSVVAVLKVVLSG